MWNHIPVTGSFMHVQMGCVYMTVMLPLRPWYRYRYSSLLLQHIYICIYIHIRDRYTGVQEIVRAWIWVPIIQYHYRYIVRCSSPAYYNLQSTFLLVLAKHEVHEGKHSETKQAIPRQACTITTVFADLWSTLPSAGMSPRSSIECIRVDHRVHVRASERGVVQSEEHEDNGRPGTWRERRYRSLCPRTARCAWGPRGVDLLARE